MPVSLDFHDQGARLYKIAESASGEACRDAYIKYLDHMWRGPGWIPNDVREAVKRNKDAFPGKTVCEMLVYITKLAVDQNLSLQDLWNDKGLLRAGLVKLHEEQYQKPGLAMTSFMAQELWVMMKDLVFKEPAISAASTAYSQALQTVPKRQLSFVDLTHEPGPPAKRLQDFPLTAEEIEETLESPGEEVSEVKMSLLCRAVMAVYGGDGPLPEVSLQLTGSDVSPSVAEEVRGHLGSWGSIFLIHRMYRRWVLVVLSQTPEGTCKAAYHDSLRDDLEARVVKAGTETYLSLVGIDKELAFEFQVSLALVDAPKLCTDHPKNCPQQADQSAREIRAVCCLQRVLMSSHDCRISMSDKAERLSYLFMLARMSSVHGARLPASFRLVVEDLQRAPGRNLNESQPWPDTFQDIGKTFLRVNMRVLYQELENAKRELTERKLRRYSAEHNLTSTRAENRVLEQLHYYLLYPRLDFTEVKIHPFAATQGSVNDAETNFMEAARRVKEAKARVSNVERLIEMSSRARSIEQRRMQMNMIGQWIEGDREHGIRQHAAEQVRLRNEIERRREEQVLLWARARQGGWLNLFEA
ncbi:hypothetical protein NM208_g6063 [Fusarium decemcellulare]|uniref:Uncharacterized protein n=1 Tax=Fusarium decemcellulare TaxID=57161 RepID=A0ACC1SEJ9_9HYPO|nr:hypothetical protein NM208_g6063 [Fusarium decemcellulare]